MVALERYAVQDFSPGDRLAAWNEQIWSSIGRLDTLVAKDAPFDAAVVFAQLGNLRLCRLNVSAHQVRRSSEQVRRDNNAFFKIVFQLRGVSAVDQGGRQLVMQPGDWSIYDASRPYTISNDETVDQLAVLTPREEFTRRGLSPSQHLLRRFSAQSGLGRLLFQHVNLAISEASSVSDSAGSDLGETTAELVRIAISEIAEAESFAWAKNSLRDRIKTYILKNIRNPELSVDAIADAMNCTKRYVHMSFVNERTTISQYVIDRRLERCCADLLNPALKNRSVTEIAFSWGFNSPAHFSRVFKARFSVTPTDYRCGRGPGARPDGEGWLQPPILAVAS